MCDFHVRIYRREMRMIFTYICEACGFHINIRERRVILTYIREIQTILTYIYT